MKRAAILLDLLGSHETRADQCTTAPDKFACAPNLAARSDNEDEELLNKQISDVYADSLVRDVDYFALK